MPALSLTQPRPRTDLLFAGGFAVIALLAALLAGWIPIVFSIATVFLFAGPHNWLEARYVLGRLPARTGPLLPFFVVSIAGILLLCAGFAMIPHLAKIHSRFTDQGVLYAAWNTAFLAWLATLISMRSRTNPRFEAGWVWPLMFLLIAGVWLEPYALGFTLVYLHPLMALWLLDRELRRSHRDWLPAYRRTLVVIPLLWGLLAWRLHGAPDLPGEDVVSRAIIAHSGSWFFSGVSSHLLVASHTFLEMVHYGVWVVLIPLIGYRSRPWMLETIPVARRGGWWRRGVVILLCAGLLVTATLWTCFLIDYSVTRSVYFTVAMLHVLAEIPFLLRML